MMPFHRPLHVIANKVTMLSPTQAKDIRAENGPSRLADTVTMYYSVHSSDYNTVVAFSIGWVMPESLRLLA